ncbi:MAG: type I 3-dehydroquinate dehydratase [Sedimentibacter sp.]
MNYVQVKDLVLKDGNPKICVPITGITDYQIICDFENLRYYDFDLVELRIDYYECVEDSQKVSELLVKIKKIYDKPILFTFRTKEEGGMHEMSEEKYFSLNQDIIKSGLIDLIDIELLHADEKIKEIIFLAKQNDVKVIMSNHDFLKTPSKDEIISTLVKMQEFDADITKIAVMPNCEEDVLTLMAATLEMKKEKGDRPFITMSMGPLGIVTRLTGHLLGSCLTFTALNKSSAPGQISVKGAREILNIMLF